MKGIMGNQKLTEAKTSQILAISSFDPENQTSWLVDTTLEWKWAQEENSQHAQSELKIIRAPL